MKNVTSSLILMILLLASGCARVVVIPFGGKDDPAKQGVRYYAPQLYLLVTYALPDAALTPQTSTDSTVVLKKVPASAAGKLKVTDETATTTRKSSALTQSATPVATYKFFYLPDYNQGYRVKQSGFIGSSELSMKLGDGWQLTEFGAKSDTQLAAVLEAASAVLPLVLGINDSPAPTSQLFKVDLKATPIAFTPVVAFPSH